MGAVSMVLMILLGSHCRLCMSTIRFTYSELRPLANYSGSFHCVFSLDIFLGNMYDDSVVRGTLSLSTSFDAFGRISFSNAAARHCAV